MNSMVKTRARHVAVLLLASAMSLAMATGVAQPATSAPENIGGSLLASGPSTGSAQHKPDPDGPEASGDFTLLHSRIAEAFPDDFTRSLTDDKGTHSIWFKEAVPSEAAKWSAAVDGVVLIPGAGYSGRELEEYTSRLLAAHSTDASVQISIVITPVEAEQLIHVTFGPGYGDATVPDTRAVQASMQEFASSNPPPSDFRVQFTSVDQQIATPEAPHGGRQFDFVYNGSWKYCTGGFPIKRNGGSELGVLTAGHCGGTGNYDGVGDMFLSPVSGSQATTTTYPGGDFRWNHSKVMLSGYTDVRGGAPHLRQFATAATRGLGDTLCGSGVTTGYKCDLVSYSGVLAYISAVPGGSGDYQIGPLRCTDTHVTGGGDSGGPWFLNYVAYGIHSGAYLPYGGAPSTGSCWSSMQNALTRFGITPWIG